MTTFDILQALQAEVGSRRAGSDGEGRAQAWLVARCQALGLPVALDEFAFIGSERYRPLMQLAFVLLTLTGLALSLAGLALPGAILVLLAFYAMFSLRKRWEVRLARTPSQNIIAGLKRPLADYAADSDSGPAVLLCAHYDTPRNMPGWAEKTRNAFRLLGPLALLGLLLYGVTWLLAGLSWLLAALGWGGLQDFMSGLLLWLGWLALIMAAPVLLLMFVSSLGALLGRKSDSPGADDNGSGTAVVLEVARRLKENPPANLEAFFAWWGAEEYGLFGSRQFVRRFHDRLDRDRFYVINADCVGVGQLLAVHTGQGTLSRRHTDPATVERVERLAGRLGIQTRRTWESIISGGSSDHAEWVDRGYRHAISVLRENDRPMPLPGRLFAALLRIPDANQLELNHIHTTGDTIEGIRPEVLEGTADLVEAYVREIDQERTAE